MSIVSELIPAPGSEGARRASVDSGARAPEGVVDPEVTEHAKRRRFTAEYKLRILRKADACKGDGDVGALLRREGLYSSQLAAWRRQRDEVAKTGLKARKRGPKAKAVDPRFGHAEEVAELGVHGLVGVAREREGQRCCYAVVTLRDVAVVPDVHGARERGGQLQRRDGARLE